MSVDEWVTLLRQSVASFNDYRGAHPTESVSLFESDLSYADLHGINLEGADLRRFVRRVAQAKVQAVMPQAPGRVILGADSVVVLDNQTLGTPVDAEAARQMLRLLAGRDHFVLTAVCLIDPRSESASIQTSVTRTSVECSPIDDEEIDWYVATGEPLRAVGGYAVEGLASRFITRLDGFYSNLVGLPVTVVYALCRQAGLLRS